MRCATTRTSHVFVLTSKSALLTDSSHVCSDATWKRRCFVIESTSFRCDWPQLPNRVFRLYFFLQWKSWILYVLRLTTERLFYHYRCWRRLVPKTCWKWWLLLCRTLLWTFVVSSQLVTVENFQFSESICWCYKRPVFINVTVFIRAKWENEIIINAAGLYVEQIVSGYRLSPDNFQFRL